MKLKLLAVALVAGVVVLAAVSAAYYWYVASSPASAPSVMRTYRSQAYGISFAYPDELLLAEADSGAAGHARHTIALVPKVIGGSASMVTIDVIENDSPKMSLADYFAEDPHHAAANGTFATSSPQSIVPAIIYQWSTGTTTGETTAFAHGSDIIAVSEAYPTAQSSGALSAFIVTAYRNLLSSFALAN